MRIIIISIIVLLGFSQNKSWCQTFDHAISFGGVQHDVANAITSDNQSNVYVTGSFIGINIDFSNGQGIGLLTSFGNGIGRDIFIVKYDSAGNYIWGFNMGSGEGQGNDIVSDLNGNLYVTGSLGPDSTDFDPGPGSLILVGNPAADIFIAKYTESGSLVWATGIFGPGGSTANSIDIDENKNSYIAGSFGGTFDFDSGPSMAIHTSNGPYDGFIAKFDPNGNFQWVSTIDAPSYNYNLGISYDGFGSIYYTGQFSGSDIDFDPDTTISNYTSALGGTNPSLFISKLDTSGQFQWCNLFDTDYGYSWGLDIDCDDIGQPVVGGFIVGDSLQIDPNDSSITLSSMGMQDIFVGKYNNQGGLIFGRNFGGSLEDASYAIASGSNNSILISGYFDGLANFDPGVSNITINSNGSKDIFLLKLDSTGNFESIITIGGDLGGLYERGLGITTDFTGLLYLVGKFSISSSPIDFDNGTSQYLLSSNGGQDGFIVAYKDFLIGLTELEQSKVNINLYPNPASHLLSYTKQNDIKELSIFDINGKIVKIISPIVNPINISDIPSGIYFLRGIYKETTIIKKFVKN